MFFASVIYHRLYSCYFVVTLFLLESSVRLVVHTEACPPFRLGVRARGRIWIVVAVKVFFVLFLKVLVTFADRKCVREVSWRGTCCCCSQRVEWPILCRFVLGQLKLLVFRLIRCMAHENCVEVRFCDCDFWVMCWGFATLLWAQGGQSFWTSLQLPIFGKPLVVSMKRILATEEATAISCIWRKYRESCDGSFSETTGGEVGVGVTLLMVVVKRVDHQALDDTVTGQYLNSSYQHYSSGWCIAVVRNHLVQFAEISMNLAGDEDEEVVAVGMAEDTKSGTIDDTTIEGRWSVRWWRQETG